MEAVAGSVELREVEVRCDPEQARRIRVHIRDLEKLAKYREVISKVRHQVINGRVESGGATETQEQ
jgi:citrate lyase gamma subunit